MIKMEEKEMKKKNNKRETCKGWTGSQDEALYREKDVLWRSKEKLAGAKTGSKIEAFNLKDKYSEGLRRRYNNGIKRRKIFQEVSKHCQAFSTRGMDAKVMNCLYEEYMNCDLY